MALAYPSDEMEFEYPDSAPETAKGPGPSNPFDPEFDNTMDKIACIEEMINRMEDIPSPSEVFLKGVLSEVQKDDIYQMVEAQKHMLSRFEKTNEMLLNFNSLSMSRFEATHQEFRRHTQLLTDMKKDLDSVFRRIRTLKSKLAKQYPGAFNAATASTVLDEEDEEEENGAGSRRPVRLRAPPPRPPQPQRRVKRSPRSSPQNRHSWAGPPTSHEFPAPESARDKSEAAAGSSSGAQAAETSSAREGMENLALGGRADSADNKEGAKGVTAQIVEGEGDE